VRIGKRVWLGPNCSIMNQITIGDDSVIGLGAIVARSVDGSSVYASPPARLIKKL
jgi:acetyltransferase-like isoleucine patch superfamily enzyme